MKATNKGLALIGSLGLGAGLMSIFDPETGKRRRALMRDKMNRFKRKSADAMDATSRDVNNRISGFVAKVRSLISKEVVTDDVLRERVRAKLGFLVSHPSSIDVVAENGKVILSGPILQSEVDRLLRRVSSIPSVASVETRLEVHESADSIPGLQGQPGPRTGERPDVMQSNWSPATRLFAGAAAGASLAWGVRRRDALGAALSVFGTGLLARALANMEFKRLFGLGAGVRAVDVQKIINVAAPVEEVFCFWTNYQNFPCFMSNVRDVREVGENRSHWVVAGPAGTNIEWDAVTTSCVPNERLEWETLPGSPVQHAGIVKFQPNRDGTTRLDIRISYNPVAGAFGHAVASLFGADAKSQMDEDLMRMKSVIETGVPPHDAAAKTKMRA